MTGEAEEGRQVQPDAAQPEVVNGDFEIAPKKEKSELKDYVPGWYYGRQVRRLETAQGLGDAAQGIGFARFENETPGLGSHLLQGIPIDGRHVSMFRLSGKVRTQGVRQGPTVESNPMIAISLYDEQRRDLGTFWLGPFRGSRPWREFSRLVTVPLGTREAILRIGLFGATGQADFDAVAIETLQ